jgi:hypothetical protein
MPALAQHAEAGEHQDGIRVQMDQLTLDVIQDRDKEFAWWKAKPTNQM